MGRWSASSCGWRSIAIRRKWIAIVERDNEVARPRFRQLAETMACNSLARSTCDHLRRIAMPAATHSLTPDHRPILTQRSNSAMLSSEIYSD